MVVVNSSNFGASCCMGLQFSGLLYGFAVFWLAVRVCSFLACTIRALWFTSVNEKRSPNVIYYYYSCKWHFWCFQLFIMGYMLHCSCSGCSSFFCSLSLLKANYHLSIIIYLHFSIHPSIQPSSHTSIFLQLSAMLSFAALTLRLGSTGCRGGRRNLATIVSGNKTSQWVAYDSVISQHVGVKVPHGGHGVWYGGVLNVILCLFFLSYLFILPLFN